MSTNSNDQGRAYEYAWIHALYRYLKEIRHTCIKKNSSYAANERAWTVMTPNMQEMFVISAEAAVDQVLELEPRMVENSSDELTLEFQTDERGILGDESLRRFPYRGFPGKARSYPEIMDKAFGTGTWEDCIVVDPYTTMMGVPYMEIIRKNGSWAKTPAECVRLENGPSETLYPDSLGE